MVEQVFFTHNRKQLYTHSGFTLVELMIALAITGVIVAATYTAYISQQRTYGVQDQVAEMQQNLRAAMTIIADELRMAGYDGGAGTKDSSCNLYTGSTLPAIQPGVLSLNAQQLDFSMDLNKDGDCADTGENLTYAIYTTGNGVKALGRRDNTTASPAMQAVAMPFDAIEFIYKDQNGAIVTQVANIRNIQISLLARATNFDLKFTNTLTYCPGSNPVDPTTGQCTNPAATIWGPYNDHYRRRLLIAEINSRNIGL